METEYFLKLEDFKPDPTGGIILIYGNGEIETPGDPIWGPELALTIVESWEKEGYFDNVLGIPEENLTDDKIVDYERQLKSAADGGARILITGDFTNSRRLTEKCEGIANCGKAGSTGIFVTDQFRRVPLAILQNVSKIIFLPNSDPTTSDQEIMARYWQFTKTDLVFSCSHKYSLMLYNADILKNNRPLWSFVGFYIKAQEARTPVNPLAEPSRSGKLVDDYVSKEEPVNPFDVCFLINHKGNTRWVPFIVLCSYMSTTFALKDTIPNPVVRNQTSIIELRNRIEALELQLSASDKEIEVSEPVSGC